MVSRVFLICSPPYRLEPGSLTEPGSQKLARMASQRDHPKLYNYRLALLCLATSVGVRDSNSGPRAFVTSISLSELSPRSLN